MRGDIALREQAALLQRGVEALGRAVIFALLRPAREGGDRAGRAIAVVDFQIQVFAREVGLHAGKRLRHVAPQHAFGGIVAGQGTPGEIVYARIAHVLDDAGRDIAQIDEAFGQALGRAYRCRQEGSDQ